VLNSNLYIVPFQSYRRLLFKFETSAFFEPPLACDVYLGLIGNRVVSHKRKKAFCVFSPVGGLEATYDDHLRLIGKCVVDFLSVLIELLVRCYG